MSTGHNFMQPRNLLMKEEDETSRSIRHSDELKDSVHEKDNQIQKKKRN